VLWHETLSLVHLLGGGLASTCCSQCFLSVDCTGGVADFIWLYVDSEVFRFRTEGSFQSIAEVNGTLNCIFLSYVVTGSEGMKVDKQHLEHSPASIPAATGWGTTCC
jgi:hypothetical protein